MALIDMQNEIRGAVPKIPAAFCKTLINRSWREIREANLWSFNLFESSWITPPPITIGTATVTQGSANIQFDTTAIAAINAAQIASPYSLITQRQFRPGTVAGIGGIYNLISYSPITGAGLLDRIMADAGGSGMAFTIYQNYYTPPMKDFLNWISVRNMSLFLDMVLTATRAQVDAWDPQRSFYQFPTHVIPYQTDHRGEGTVNASATLGYPIYELWGVPVTPFVYTCYGIRKGTDLVQPTDTLPVAVGEDLVLAKAYQYAYEWAESHKDMTPRAVGPDFKFLMGAKQKEYGDLLTKYRRQDKEFINNWWLVRAPNGGAGFGYFYNTVAGVASPNAS